MYISSTMAAILMTSFIGPDAKLRWANWFKLLHMTQSLFWYRSPKSSQNLHGMPIRHRLTEGNENCREYTVFSIGNIPVSQEIMSKIRHETENDMALIKLRETVLQGWPQIKQTVDPCLREYWNFRDELSETDGFLLKRERLIIP